MCVRFCRFHPRERKMASVSFWAQVQRVSITRESLERELLDLRVVQVRHCQVFSSGHISRDIRKMAELVLGAYGRRSIDGLVLPGHVKAWWRAWAVLLSVLPLIGTGVLVKLTSWVEMFFPIHACGAQCGNSVLSLCVRLLCCTCTTGATLGPPVGVSLAPCDPASP